MASEPFNCRNLRPIPCVSKLFLWLIFVPPACLSPAPVSMKVIYRNQNSPSFRLLEYSLASISSFIWHNGLSHSQVQVEVTVNTMIIISTFDEDQKPPKCPLNNIVLWKKFKIAKFYGGLWPFSPVWDFCRRCMCVQNLSSAHLDKKLRK